MSEQMAKDIENIDLDLSEVIALEASAKRPNVKTLLATEVKRLAQKKNQLSKRLAEESTKSSTASAIDSTSRQPSLGSVNVTNYMWDQNEEFVKIYIEIDKNYSLDPKQIEMTFQTKKSFSIVFGKYKFTISRLFGDIDGANSCHKITKSGKLIISLKKMTKKHWNSITETENSLKLKKSLEEEKDDSSADPSAGIMKLMKQMYDDGDDDMKRTIAKSWYETQNKQKTGDVDFKANDLDI